MEEQLNPTVLRTIKSKWDSLYLGEEHHKQTVLRYMRRAIYDASRPPHRPLCAFILAGPTGSGKTFFLETLGQSLLRTSSTSRIRGFIKINCGELSLEHEVSRLTGSPPGYLGHGETKALLDPNLIAQVSENSLLGAPMIMFDEIEKAHPSIQKHLLGILEGEFTVGTNKGVPLGNAIIAFTTNLGTKELTKSASGLTPSFHKPIPQTRDYSQFYRRAISNQWSPEFMNRIDDILYIDAPSQSQIRSVLTKMVLDTTLQSPSNPFIKIAINKAAEDMLITKVDTNYGYRDLRRVFNQYILDPAISMLDTCQSTHTEHGLEYQLTDERSHKLIQVVTKVSAAAAATNQQ